MNKLEINVWTLLLIVLIVTCGAESQSVGSSQGTLAYSAKPSTHPTSFLLKSPRGLTYRLSLVPDFDVRKHVVVLDLVLQGPGKNADDATLLDSTGNLHGYQPYVFAASDFVAGAQKSAYGESRVIDLRKRGMEMRVKVAEVHVGPTPTGSSPRLGYRFDSLTLEITTQSLAGKSPNKSAP